MMTAPTLRTAGNREAGSICPHCQQEIALGEATASCVRCGAVQHPVCWDAHGGCGSYECRPARAERPGSAYVLRITTDDLTAAVPLPSFGEAARLQSTEALAKQTEAARRWNRLAILSFVVALIGIPGFGIVTGLLAVLLGCIALALHNPNRRGVGLAVGGIMLGLGDFVVWAAVMFGMFAQHAVHVSLDEFEPDPQAMMDLPGPIGRAMKANVLIQTQSGWKGVLGQGLGSGVILRIADNEALIVTNRHVIDPGFSGERNAVDADLSRMWALQIKLLGQPSLGGKVVWVASQGIDLALVTVPVVAPEPQSAIWENPARLQIGDRVFAVGNPHGLGWTHTAGEVSQLRKQMHGATELRIIQTTAAINPGNSGGGLYDNDGHLIGINTWTQDKRVAEGLNFAVAFQALLTLVPAPFQLPDEQSAETQPNNSQPDANNISKPTL